MPETKLFEGKYFGVEKFDRSPQGKNSYPECSGISECRL